MNTKLITSFACAATLLCGTALAAEKPTTADRLKDAAADAGNALQRAAGAVGEGAREAWTKTKAYISDDPDTYRTGATQKLGELRQELAQLRERSAGIKERAYFATLLKALEQQHQFASKQLADLPPDDIRKGREGTRRGVDRTLERLEEHLDVAQKEVRDFRDRTR